MARPTRESRATVVRARRRPDAARCVQSGQTCGCAIGTGTGGGDLEDSVPERPDGGGAGAAAAAGIFFRLRVAARSGAPASAHRWRHSVPSRPRCGSAQRHTSKHRRPRADALLIDLHGLPWDEAWRICVETFSYTNHTLLPEALESWPLPVLERMLPRHLE